MYASSPDWGSCCAEMSARIAFDPQRLVVVARLTTTLVFMAALTSPALAQPDASASTPPNPRLFPTVTARSPVAAGCGYGSRGGYT
jgi:hypothetical protein